MALTINNTITQRLRTMSALGWLVTANLAVFLILRLIAACNIFLGDRSMEAAALSFVELPLSIPDLIRHPWTVVTYMFSQFDVFHLIFNVLWLYWFGQFFLDFSTERRLVGLYLAGGLTGAFLFVLAGNFLPSIPMNSHLIGSSASVLAIVAATAIVTPNREIGIMFLGGVKLKWIALIMVVFDLIGIGADNAGGNIAHIGGALAGLVAALWMLRRHPRMKAAEPAGHATQKPAGEAELDRLLDKIRRSGYGSLTIEERRTLFEISNRMK